MMVMQLIPLGQPSSEPISPDDAKAFLRITETAEDELISGTIATARVLLEQAGSLAMIMQSWQLRFSLRRLSDLDFCMRLPLRPVNSISAVRMDNNGIMTVLEPAQYVSQTRGVDQFVTFSKNTFGAAQDDAQTTIDIEFVAGVATDRTCLPAPMKHAVRVLVAELYNRRGNCLDEPAVMELFSPAFLARFLSPYVGVRL